MSTKEIITLQFGHYANFVGTHWWNIQESSFQYDSATGGEKEEIDHDVLFREGETNRGEITFTPRLVLTELKGGLGSLKSSGVLYDEHEEENGMSVAWHGDVDVHKQTSEPKNQFLMDLDNGEDSEIPKSNGKSDAESENNHKPYNMEKDVKVWSDYLRTYLHPKSTLIVNNYSHRSENDPFDLLTKGSNLKNTLEEIEERIRFYAEECDQMQGFHILADSYNGFAGLSSSALQYLHDEFSSKQLVTFPVFPTKFDHDSKTKSLKRDLNKALSLPMFMEHSTLVCPLSLCTGSFPNLASQNIPHLLYDAHLHYHTSSILAAALDTATLNHRLKGNNGINLNHFCDDLTFASKNLGSMSILMPFPLLSGSRTYLDQDFSTLAGFLEGHLEKEPWSLISQDFEAGQSSSEIVGEIYSQSLTIRGLPNNKLMSYYSPNSGIFSQCTTQNEMLNFYLSKRFYGCNNTVASLSEPMKTLTPFPQFFDSRVTQNGLLSNISSKAEFQPWDLRFHRTEAISKSGIANGDCSRDMKLSNGHVNGNSNGDISNFQSHVESIPIMTNIQCSSKAVNVLNSSAICLRQGKKRHFSFHGMENENLETVIEDLCTLQDEYKTHDLQIASESDSDGDI